MECQLHVCQAYRLSLHLHKSHIFSKQFEFVSINACTDRLCPVMAKHQLFEHWPQPKFIWDVWYGARIGGTPGNAINLFLRLFLYHFLHTTVS